jgi:hypothetical protein
MKKAINYMARDFEDVKSELITFSKRYYPEISDKFDDSSVGAWFIDLMAAVGDELSFYIDKAYQETNITSTNTVGGILNFARNNGVKIPGPKAAMCEVEFSCVLPIDGTNIALPDFETSPIVKRNTIISNSSNQFELTENVDFSEQFNSDGFSNRRFIPNIGNNGVATSYTVYKSTIAIGGTTKVYKKNIQESEIKPFMEIILPEKDVMNIESIIFKESGSIDAIPKTYEYYVDDEVFRVKDESIKTYRFFEVDSLSQQYRFGTETDERHNEIYDDYTEIYDENSEISSGETISRIYRGKWKAVSQKFITERTNNGYTKIIFGGGVSESDLLLPSGATLYGEYRMSKMINNDMLGILPRGGWVMFVRYRIGGGVESNVAANSINTLQLSNVSFKNPSYSGLTQELKTRILRSIEVTNITTAVCGKDAPSTEEMKFLIKYNNGANNRCVTIKDYMIRLMQMHPRYGAPFRSNIIEENNKIVMYLLNVNSRGKLITLLPSTLVNNIKEYMSHYKMLTDYIEIKSGRIINLGFMVDVFVDKTYEVGVVVQEVINKVYEYMDIRSHFMNESIFIGDLEKEINLIDGVLSLISLRVYNIYYGEYGDKSTLPQYETNVICGNGEIDEFNVKEGSRAYQIDLNKIDMLLYGEENAMYEIKEKEDIRVRVKLR